MNTLWVIPILHREVRCSVYKKKNKKIIECSLANILLLCIIVDSIYNLITMGYFEIKSRGPYETE